jgi:hypothetical protein
LVHLFEDAVLCTVHAKRVTLSKLNLGLFLNIQVMNQSLVISYEKMILAFSPLINSFCKIQITFKPLVLGYLQKDITTLSL